MLENTTKDGDIEQNASPTTKEIKSNTSHIQEEKHEPYTVFSKGTLIRLLAIASLTGMMSPLTANIYLPALNEIQADLHTTTENVNLTVTVYMIFQAISPTFWGSLADSWGRRCILLATVVVYCCACIGLALAPNYAALVVFRMLQAFGSSSVIAIGAGILSDIADVKSRGSYFGWYTTGQHLGPVLGPVLGGVIAQKLSWRWIFWILLMIGGAAIVLVTFFVPETLRAIVGNGIGYYNPTPLQWLARRRGKLNEDDIQRAKENRVTGRLPKLKNLNKIKGKGRATDDVEEDGEDKNPRKRHRGKGEPFTYLVQPDVILILLYNGLHYTAYYCFLTSTTKQFSLHFGLSELEIGLCFLCIGAGTTIGSTLNGKILDRDYRVISSKFMSQNPGAQILDVPIYRARFRTLWVFVALMQIVTLIYGWCFHVNAPLAVILILQFIIGFCLSCIFTSSQTLLVDLYPGKGASITASNNLVRCLLGAIATVAIDPGIEGIGIGMMFTTVGLILVASNAFVPILFKYGPGWRKRRAEKLEQKKTEN